MFQLESDPFDPRIVLNPDASPNSDWAGLLRAGNGNAARDAFVRELRTGEARTCVEHDVAAIYEQWYGTRIGFQGGMRYDPDLVVNQHYVGVYGVVHRFEGEINWWFDPTAERGERKTREWSAQFNRHYQWIPLAEAYAATGDARYARTWENELRTWTRQCPRPPVIDNAIVPNPWRTIEMGIRAAWTWPAAFEIFRRSAHISDEALWIFVCMMREHGTGLLETPTARNFKAMEVNGLGHVGLMFPELRGAAAFASTAIDRAVAEIERQFYPDGSQIELAPAYSGVSITNLFSVLMLARVCESRRGRQAGWEITPHTWDRLAGAVEFLGRIADPDGRWPAMHDSDHHDGSGAFEHFRKQIGGERFARKPWLSGKSDLIPWAGYAILRRRDRYALFDAGPYGAAHQHADALQLLTYAHGRWFTIDPGKPIYDASAVTRHVRSAAGHNVVLCEGRLHGDDPLLKRIDQPLPVAHHDHAAGARRRHRTNDGSDITFTHERAVIDVESIGWLVFDRLTPDDDRPHHWEWLWHLAVDELTINGNRATAQHRGGPALYLHCVGSPGLKLGNVAGQTQPALRGWLPMSDGRPAEPIPTLQITTDPAIGLVWLCTLFALRKELAIDSVTWTQEFVTMNVGGEMIDLREPIHEAMVTYPGSR